MSVIIRNLDDLCNYLGTEPKHIESDVYDSTECGAWIHTFDDRVELGSIVEGSDVEFSCSPLMYPFTSDDYDDAIEWLESEVDYAWRDANLTIHDENGYALYVQNEQGQWVDSKGEIIPDKVIDDYVNTHNDW